MARCRCASDPATAGACNCDLKVKAGDPGLVIEGVGSALDPWVLSSKPLSEVEVSDTEPTDPESQIWFDTSLPDPCSTTASTEGDVFTGPVTVPPPGVGADPVSGLPRCRLNHAARWMDGVPTFRDRQQAQTLYQDGCPAPTTGMLRTLQRIEVGQDFPVTERFDGTKWVVTEADQAATYRNPNAGQNIPVGWTSVPFTTYVLQGPSGNPTFGAFQLDGAGRIFLNLDGFFEYTLGVYFTAGANTGNAALAVTYNGTRIGFPSQMDLNPPATFRGLTLWLPGLHNITRYGIGDTIGVDVFTDTPANVVISGYIRFLFDNW